MAIQNKSYSQSKKMTQSFNTAYTSDAPSLKAFVVPKVTSSVIVRVVTARFLHNRANKPYKKRARSKTNHKHQYDKVFSQEQDYFTQPTARLPKQLHTFHSQFITTLHQCRDE